MSGLSHLIKTPVLSFCGPIRAGQAIVKYVTETTCPACLIAFYDLVADCAKNHKPPPSQALPPKEE